MKVMFLDLTAPIAQLVERLLSEWDVAGFNPAGTPYQRCKNGTSSSLSDVRIKRGCERKIE